MTRSQLIIKRIFDFLLSLFIIPLIIIPTVFLIFISTLETKLFGLFLQKRVGQNGKLFYILKIRTIDRKGRIKSFSRFLRKSKLDELPQIFNIFIGQMSFVGPRPDIPEVIDKIKAKDRIVLTVKPGLTGPATLLYFDEENLLNEVDKPEDYSLKVLLPKKTAINKSYIENYHIFMDFKYIYKTILNVF